MKGRTFDLVALISTAGLCLLTCAWLVAGTFDPRKHFVHLWSGCYVGIDSHGSDARLEIFDSISAGPYGGSIVGIAGSPNAPKVFGIGDIAGIYCRLFRWPDGRSIWTFSLSLFYAAEVAAIVPLFWIARRTRLIRIEKDEHHADRSASSSTIAAS